MKLLRRVKDKPPYFTRFCAKKQSFGFHLLSVWIALTLENRESAKDKESNKNKEQRYGIGNMRERERDLIKGGEIERGRRFLAIERKGIK